MVWKEAATKVRSTRQSLEARALHATNPTLKLINNNATVSPNESMNTTEILNKTNLSNDSQTYQFGMQDPIGLKNFRVKLTNKTTDDNGKCI